ncbi:MAG TPA: CHRD domain-containing protein [Anaerolineales bacterium]|nr:CHRD domain-containing protein [Anaerolineales bacterium]
MKKTKILRMIPIMIAILALPSFVAAGGRPFSTTLTGEAEVTAAGVPNQGDLDGEGTAHITLNQGQGEVCFEINVSDITLPAIGAHIHVGAATTTGPVVVGLTPPDADGSSSGCVSANPDLIKAIRQNPENYYVNIHTTDYPAGAVRGQLGK